MPEDLLDTLPRLRVGDAVDTAFDWVTRTFAPVFDLLGDALRWCVDSLADALQAPPALLLVLVLALLGAAVRSVAFGVLSALGLLLVVSMGLWDAAMQTLALIVTAGVLATLLAVPIGVLAARHDRFSAVLRPVLDLMQTMPAFVYLIPAIVLFGIGVVPGVVVTVIFAMPPGVRLTELGIRQVDREVVEAGHAFGSSPGQILRQIQLPLALPTISAGINQVIMLALSMAVIAGLIGAGGLGSEVTRSISQVDLGSGVEAGLAVVVLAIYLDRLTAASGPRRGLVARLRSPRPVAASV